MPRIIPPQEWRPQGIASLEPEADIAVRAATNTAVIAGPGAGKTELLAQRACFLLQTDTCPRPRRILAISFKRDAARNLRERVRSRCGVGLSRRFDSLTFDAFAKNILDQFVGALPPELRPSTSYDVLPGSPKSEDVDVVLSQMSPPTALGTRDGLRAYGSATFFKEKVLRANFAVTPTTLEGWAAREFWSILLAGPRSKLYFPMISRLAGHILQTDPRVLLAYRATYTHVFLDEFQDTTDLQYWLVKTLFMGTPAMLTAVGDPQQRIMGWAGAKKDIFECFARDFAAQERRLVRNHRSSGHIAPVVRYFADHLRTILPADDAVAVAALEAEGPPPDACEWISLPNPQEEAAWIAGEVTGLIGSGAKARDIAILVRQRAVDFAPPIIAALHSAGIKARLEEAMQDILTEPAALIALLALRALLCKSPGPAWAKLREEIADLRGIWDDGERSLAVVDKELQAKRRALMVEFPAPLTGQEAFEGFFRDHIEPLYSTALCSRHPQYRRGSFYADQMKKLCAELDKASHEGTWDAVLEEIEGLNSVPILTIHKSKGLEYHAVFFVGLEDGAFWNFQNTPDEELNAFFVALSRAKERVVFTFSERRMRWGTLRPQSRTSIDLLYRLLAAAGVRQHGSP